MKNTKRAIIASLLPSAVAVGLVLMPSAAQAASGTTLGTLNIRQSASTSAKVVGTLKKGARVNFDCYVNGSTTTGPYGKSTMWLRLNGNNSTWVAESWVYTGTNSATAPKCGATTSSSSSTKTQKAVSWAKAQVGSYAYDGLCERFVENAYGTQGKYGSAIANYNAQKQAGRINTSRTNIPAGALVFAYYPAYDRGYGHVQLSIGGGKFVSGGMGRDQYGRLTGPTVQIRSTLPAGYLGWSYAPTGWPGR